jgi:hypothetical protein
MSNDTKTTNFNFPFKKLTPIVGEPTKATTTNHKRQIYANAMENIITLDELAENVEKLNEPWNSDQPIRMLWERIRECQRIGTAGGEPISDRMAMFTALKLLDGTGVFSTHTHGWRQTYPLQSAWTIDTFKEFFNHADKERKKMMTTKDADTIERMPQPKRHQQQQQHPHQNPT